MHMNAAHLHLHAAICKSVAAGNTFTAIEIRNECHLLAFFKSADVINLHQLTGKFMTQYSWIFEIRLRAFECVKVCAANADAFYFYYCLAGLQFRHSCFGIIEL